MARLKNKERMNKINEQIARQDFVDNHIFETVLKLIPDKSKRKQLRWDINRIAMIRNLIWQWLNNNYLIKPGEFYPYEENNYEQIL
jgi:hypothetical protein